MIYRKLPHGDEQISILGLGANGVAENGDLSEMQVIYEMAIESGINFFDMAGENVEPFAPLGHAMKGRRDKVYVQLHFGADYMQYKYGWTMDVKRIQKSVELQMEKLQTDYIDFGYIHCLDEEQELDKAIHGGILAMVQQYKKQGKVRHIGFSSHNPAVVQKMLDYGGVDMVMFSINPAYDYTDEDYGIGSTGERMELYRRCEREGVGIVGINVGLVNKYFDLAQSGDDMALEHYRILEKHAGDCTRCGHCDRRCPFHVKQSGRMEKIQAYFGE